MQTNFTFSIVILIFDFYTFNFFIIPHFPPPANLDKLLL